MSRVKSPINPTADQAWLDNVLALPDFKPGAFPSGTADGVMHLMFPEPAPYQDNPAGWIRDVLGEHVWSKQEEICQSVVDNRYTAVKACHGPGKSFIAARIGCWWLNVFELGDAFLVTTAPSWPQVQAILWREMRRAHNKGRLPGRITLDCHWYMGEGRSEEELIAMGRKPADYNEDAFQGLHARYILIILDEACGVPVSLWTAIMTLMTNESARVLAIGNPDDPGSHFAKVCKPGSGWNVISIPAFDSPNFTGEKVPPDVAEVLVQPLWVDDRRREWSEDSPLWVSKVLAEFPDVSDEYLFNPSIINAMCVNELPGLGPGRYGADIARFGRNKSVVYRNRDGVIRYVDEWALADTMTSTGKIAYILKQHHEQNPVPITVDATGVGGGVVDRLRELRHDCTPFEGGTRAFRPDKFKNRRSEAYWTFRILAEEGLIDLDPADEVLLSQLGNIKWFVDSAGRIQLETKEDMEERGVPSPDRADAAVYSTVAASTAYVPGIEGSIASDLLGKVM